MKKLTEVPINLQYLSYIIVDPITDTTSTIKEKRNMLEYELISANLCQDNDRLAIICYYMDECLDIIGDYFESNKHDTDASILDVRIELHSYYKFLYFEYTSMVVRVHFNNALGIGGVPSLDRVNLEIIAYIGLNKNSTYKELCAFVRLSQTAVKRRITYINQKGISFPIIDIFVNKENRTHYLSLNKYGRMFMDYWGSSNQRLNYTVDRISQIRSAGTKYTNIIEDILESKQER